MMRTNSLRRFLLIVAAVPMLAFVAGCDELDKAASDAPAKPMGTTMVAPGILAPDPTPMPKESSPANNQTTPPADSNAAAPNDPTQATPPAPESGTTVEKADGTQGEKGQGYGGGIITEPVSQYFQLQNRITLNIEIAKQMQLWRAEHNRFPKNLAEYEKVILQPLNINSIKDLPELPMNCKYIYDAKTGELMVEKRTGQ
jgi:hypothetical protein